MAKWLVMWTGSIAAFVVFVIITQILLGGDREFQTSGDEGFKLLYPQDLPLNGIHFLVDTATNPTKILFFAVVDVENRQDYSLLALQIPYSGALKEESDWKEFICSEDNPCTFVDNIQYFEFELDEPIDQKQAFRHSVRLWFSQVNPLLDQEIPPLIKQFNPHRKPYKIGFDDVAEAKATVILDKSSDSFAPTPNAPIIPGPREGTIQLDWPLQGGVLHQIDYQLPAERNLESQTLYYTALFGIGLGITNLAIYGAEQRSKKLKIDKKRKQRGDHYDRDAIDDSYHFENKGGSN
jgi:hypothetical protein